MNKDIMRRNKYIRRFLYACGYSPSGPIALDRVQMDWTIDRIREMIETWNLKEGKDKMLLIYVMNSGQVGHIGSISSMELTGVDQTSSPQMGGESEPSSKTEENGEIEQMYEDIEMFFDGLRPMLNPKEVCDDLIRWLKDIRTHQESYLKGTK